MSTPKQVSTRVFIAAIFVIVLKRNACSSIEQFIDGAYSYSEILYSYQSEWITTYNNMNELYKHNIEWRRPDITKYILNYSIYTQLKNRQN